MFLKATVDCEEIVVKWFNRATGEASRYVITDSGLELPKEAAEYGLQQYGDRLTATPKKKEKSANGC